MRKLILSNRGAHWMRNSFAVNGEPGSCRRAVSLNLNKLFEIRGCKPVRPNPRQVYSEVNPFDFWLNVRKNPRSAWSRSVTLKDRRIIFFFPSQVQGGKTLLTSGFSSLNQAKWRTLFPFPAQSSWVRLKTIPSNLNCTTMWSKGTT